MLISELKLENFRNFHHADLAFSSDIILFTGSNGQGKTSLLEAVFYLSTLRSFRTSRINELRKIGTASFSLSLSFQRAPGWRSLLEIRAGENRFLSVDHVPVSRASDFTGKIKTIAFLPDDPLIISGSSMLRRRFFDMYISMLDRNYFTALQNYSSALRSRNILLKDHKCDPSILHSYSSVLAASGSEIVQLRKKYTVILEEVMKEILSEIAPGLTHFQIRMRYNRETENAESYLNKAVSESGRDIQKGFTSFGPHLDDFEFISDGRSLRNFGSRGQCRITALTLKLAQLEAVRQSQGALKDTVVLVDDAMADLDEKTRILFMNRISSAGQLFFAFTEIPPEFSFEKAAEFKVQNGNIVF
ncbi:MAG: DNA replication and repair protein RecF [Lentisphaeria bacterium]|nr:DNA replication and repair protein RecF [Lentisphaeria bacterium]